MTLNEVSERIASGQDDAVLVGRRIRHWTNEKLIPTEGDTHSGKGRHRHYGWEGIFVAAILWELSHYNVPVGVLQRILPMVRKHQGFFDADGQSFTDTNGEGSSLRVPIWLAISFDKVSSEFKCEPIEDAYEDISSAIILNLEKILRRITKP